MTQTGTGIWTVVNGTAAITNPSSPVTTVTGITAGNSATLRWTVTSGTCSVYDDVLLENNAPPVAAVSAVVNNTCHGGNTGSVTMAVGLHYSFTIAGPTVNTTGQASGMFTGLTAGNYTITVTANGCSNTANITITEPAGTLPDISLGSDYNSNFFFTPDAESELVFNIAEVAGNAATGDTVRIIRVPGYLFAFNSAATAVTISSTTYTLDNSRWKLDESNPSFVSLIFDPNHNSSPGTLNCGGRVYISLTFRRNTTNSSSFSLSARLRRANSEANLNNNLNSVVFTAE